MRALLVALLVLLTAAPAAGAAPRALARMTPNDDDVSRIALAGDQVLFTRSSGRTLRVYSVPVTGGTPHVVFTRTAPAGERPLGVLAASAQRAALIYMHTSGSGSDGAAQVFAGPPWTAITPAIDDYPYPLFVQVDGERVFESRFTGTRFDAHVFAHDPAEHEVPFETLDQANSAMFAGDLVAYRTPYEDWKQLVVRDWHTGAVRSITAFDQNIQSILLRPDGRATVQLNNGELWDASPQRRLARQGFDPRLAGERLVYHTRSGLRVRDADGRVRPFGTTTVNSSELVADAEHVAWIANDCLLVAPVTAAPATTPGAGPCPRSELSLFRNDRMQLAHTLPVRVTCVAAPRQCRGRVLLTGYSETRRFAIPAGHTRIVRVRVTDAGYRALRKARNTLVAIDVRDDDGERMTFQATVWR